MLVGGSAPSLSMNDFLAGACGTQACAPKAALDSLRTNDASIRTQASRSAAQSGGTSTVQYSYDIGPDGQRYVSGATISTTKRTSGARNPLVPLSDVQGQPSQPLDISGQQQLASLADFLKPRSALSPADEAAIYGSDDFLNDTLNSDEAQRRMRLQIADFGVRAQEGQHFRAAFGLGSAPQYDYELGPDGELYAVGGNVGITSGLAATPEEAAKDADTMARAALAATDVSAQDVSAARSAQSRAAYLYAHNHNIIEQETPLFSFAA